MVFSSDKIWTWHAREMHSTSSGTLEYPDPWATTQGLPQSQICRGVTEGGEGVERITRGIQRARESESFRDEWGCEGNHYLCCRLGGPGCESFPEHCGGPRCGLGLAGQVVDHNVCNLCRKVFHAACDIRFVFSGRSHCLRFGCCCLLLVGRNLLCDILRLQFDAGRDSLPKCIVGEALRVRVAERLLLGAGRMSREQERRPNFAETLDAYWMLLAGGETGAAWCRASHKQSLHNSLRESVHLACFYQWLFLQERSADRHAGGHCVRRLGLLADLPGRSPVCSGTPLHGCRLQRSPLLTCRSRC